MDYHYLGLLAFIILFCGLAFIVWKWPQGRHITFSGHVAGATHKIVYYIALFACVLPLLILFFLKWFGPAYDMPVWFSVSLIVSAVAQQACTFIPETGGWKTRWHALLAGISALSLIPPLIFVLTSSLVPTAGRVLTSISLACMTGVIAVVILQKGVSNRLILQAAYYAAFFMPILALSYLL